jgi:NAD(P)-dependent dehydrogenase (short-subunit alcohol dehydrogenase family)
MNNKEWTIESIKNQQDKIVLITGANSGLGLEASKVLSQKGAKVIMAVRNIEKGKEAVASILQNNQQAKVELMHLDLSDLDSIKQFSEAFHAKYAQLDILMNNAGVMWPLKREETKQGFEIQFGTNHLGHFVLTGLLLDLIKKTPNARVVTQSSIAHKMNGNIHFDDISWSKKYNRFDAYAQSKLANLLFTYELDRLFKLHNINAIAVASHPGISTTNLFRSSGVVVNTFNRFFAQTIEMGTLPMLRAATEPNLKGSEYFGPTKLMEVRGFPELVKSNKKSHNMQLANKLWSASEQLTGVTYSF